jgi:hypothetical protein
MVQQILQQASDPAKNSTACQDTESVQIVKYFTRLLDIFREKVIRNAAGAFGVENHESRTGGIIAVAVFFLNVFQGTRPVFHQIGVEEAG